MGVIYKISSPNGKVYVGKTYDLRKRINAHKCAAKRGRNHILHNSIRKYGWDAHVLEVIETVEDEMLNERELFWIEELNTYCHYDANGMNMTKGGDGQRATWMHKPELRKWYSDRFTGKGNPFHGMKHTDETKKLISKKAIERNIKNGVLVPKWGYEKGLANIRRKVLCYDSGGNFLCEYISVTEASEKLGVLATCVSAVCNLKMTNSGGYVFRYKDSVDGTNRINVGVIKAQAIKRPVVWLTPEYEVAMEFTSAQAASDFIGIPKTTINRAAMYNYLVPIRTGHIFMYRDMWKEISKEEKAA